MQPLTEIRSSVCLAILLVVSFESVASMRNRLRSVEKCEPIEDLNLCHIHCEQKYIFVDKKLEAENQGLRRTFVGTNVDTGNLECCCQFNTYWPDFVHPNAVGREHSGYANDVSIAVCLPLFLGFRLSSRSKDSYSTMCKYLRRPMPMNMLELVQFASATSYLNFVRPKHPAILKTLKMERVAKVNMKASEQVNSALPEFLNSCKEVEEYDGYQLNPIQMNKFRKIMSSDLNEAIKSKVIAESFDEYVASYALVDTEAASRRINEINKSLKIPKDLLLGTYDKYSKEFTAEIFTLHNIDCKLLEEEAQKLAIYIHAVELVLNSLYEKGFFTHMKERYKPLKNLIRSGEVYKELINNNCNGPQRDPRISPMAGNNNNNNNINNNNRPRN